MIKLIKYMILLLITLLLNVEVLAQNFQGKATYKTHRKVDFKISDGKNAPNEEMQKQLQEQLSKQFQQTFFLNFTKEESVYKQEEQLSSPKPQSGAIFVSVVGSGGGSDVYYKNIKDNRYVNKTEIMGKRFLIKDSIPKRDWILSSETKNIGKYTCYKATSERTIEYTDISIQEGDTKEEKKKKKIITTAWYTPQIPVSNGPRDFGGLPGLILEINDNDLTIVCSEIVLNTKEKIDITEPSKGKEVTQVEYDQIMDKKQKEMMEQFRSRRKDGNHMEIKIGG